MDSLMTVDNSDLYQFTMAYAQWRAGKAEDHAVFNAFFRKDPLGGGFNIFGGLRGLMELLNHFRISDETIEYLQKGTIVRKVDLEKNFEHGLASGYIRPVENGQRFEQLSFGPWGTEMWQPIESPTGDLFIPAPMGKCDSAFFAWLKTLDCSEMKVASVLDGTVIFPREPLIQVEGPWAVGQLLETPTLMLMNFSNYVSTNAARMRLAAGWDKNMLDFGARRAPGPDGAITATVAAIQGGFDGTSNPLAGRLFGLDVKGTHAHAWIQAFKGFEDIKNPMIIGADGKSYNFVELVIKARVTLGYQDTHTGELAAATAYALAFPESFLMLVDTYNTLRSGVPNFLVVALALHWVGYRAIGIRLDSGDLAYLSREAKELFQQIAERLKIPYFAEFLNTASNDIGEENILAMNAEGHKIDTYGIGTQLMRYTGFGGVYKLVEINGDPRIKLSENQEKIPFPGAKKSYRLIGSGEDGNHVALLDLICQANEKAPRVGEKVLCRHPFDETKRAVVIPKEVMPLLHYVWDKKQRVALPGPLAVREYTKRQLQELIRPDHLRLVNPTPYKVSLSEMMYQFFHGLWMQESPVEVLQ